MDSKPDLQTKLEELLNSRNVYYNPPESLRMQYDAIRYSLSRMADRFADDVRYKSMKCYDLVVISREPDPEVVDKILELPYSSMGRPYPADNLNHYPITLYY